MLGNVPQPDRDPRQASNLSVIEGGFLIDLGNSSAAAVTIDQLSPDRGAVEGPWLASREGRQFLAADGQHVLVSEQRDTEDWLRYRWTVLTREGLRLGELLSPVSYSPFVVTPDNRLVTLSTENLRLVDDAYQAAPLRITAYALGTGQLSWEHPVRDVTYRGPFPQ